MSGLYFAPVSTLGLFDVLYALVTVQNEFTVAVWTQGDQRFRTNRMTESKRMNLSYIWFSNPEAEIFSNPINLSFLALGNRRGVGKNVWKNSLTGIGPTKDSRISSSISPQSSGAGGSPVAENLPALLQVHLAGVLRIDNIVRAGWGIKRWHIPPESHLFYSIRLTTQWSVDWLKCGQKNRGLSL